MGIQIELLPADNESLATTAAARSPAVCMSSRSVKGERGPWFYRYTHVSPRCANDKGSD